VAKVELKGPPFRLYEITMFCPQGHASVTKSRQWHGDSTNYNSSNPSVFSERNRGGNRHRGGESSVLVVQKEKPEFVTPEWMEERSSPEAKRRNPDVLDINVLLKYPSGGDLPKKNSPDPRRVQYESTIRPEVAKRDNSTPTLLDEDFEDDDDDEFEEVIVVVDVQRNPLWRKGLAKPKPERPKFGVAIHNLLELPTRRTKQETAPDELFTDEKIESVQRPPMNYEAMDLQSILENF